MKREVYGQALHVVFDCKSSDTLSSVMRNANVVFINHFHEVVASCQTLSELNFVGFITAVSGIGHLPV